VAQRWWKDSQGEIAENLTDDELHCRRDASALSYSVLRETVGVVRDLAEAQQRTEEQIGLLLQALSRTEERVGRLEGRKEGVESTLQHLAQAQLRTEEGLQRQGDRSRRSSPPSSALKGRCIALKRNSEN
jgi:hypothetical protein